MQMNSSVKPVPVPAPVPVPSFVPVPIRKNKKPRTSTRDFARDDIIPFGVTRRQYLATLSQKPRPEDFDPWASGEAKYVFTENASTAPSCEVPRPDPLRKVKEIKRTQTEETKPQKPVLKLQFGKTMFQVVLPEQPKTSATAPDPQPFHKGAQDRPSDAPARKGPKLRHGVFMPPPIPKVGNVRELLYSPQTRPVEYVVVPDVPYYGRDWEFVPPVVHATTTDVCSIESASEKCPRQPHALYARPRPTAARPATTKPVAPNAPPSGDKKAKVVRPTQRNEPVAVHPNTGVPVTASRRMRARIRAGLPTDDQDILEFVRARNADTRQRIDRAILIQKFLYAFGRHPDIRGHNVEHHLRSRIEHSDVSLKYGVVSCGTWSELEDLVAKKLSPPVRKRMAHRPRARAARIRLESIYDYHTQMKVPDWLRNIGTTIVDKLKGVKETITNLDVSIIRRAVQHLRVALGEAAAPFVDAILGMLDTLFKFGAFVCVIIILYLCYRAYPRLAKAAAVGILTALGALTLIRFIDAILGSFNLLQAGAVPDDVDPQAFGSFEDFIVAYGNRKLSAAVWFMMQDIDLHPHVSLKTNYGPMWIPREGTFYHVPDTLCTYPEYVTLALDFQTNKEPQPRQLNELEYRVFTHGYQQTTDPNVTIDHRSRVAYDQPICCPLLWQNGRAEPTLTWVDRCRRVVGYNRVIADGKTYWLRPDEAIITDKVMYWPDHGHVYAFGYGTTLTQISYQNFKPLEPWSIFLEPKAEPFVIRVPTVPQRTTLELVKTSLFVRMAKDKGTIFIPKVDPPAPAAPVDPNPEEYAEKHKDAIDEATRVADQPGSSNSSLSHPGDPYDATGVKLRPEPDAMQSTESHPLAPLPDHEDPIIPGVRTQAPNPWWNALSQSIFEISGVEVDKSKSTVYSRTILCMRNANTAAQFLKYLVQAICFLRNMLYEAVTGVPWDAKEHKADYDLLDGWVSEILDENLAPHRVLAISAEARVMSTRVHTWNSKAKIDSYRNFIRLLEPRTREAALSVQMASPHRKVGVWFIGPPGTGKTSTVNTIRAAFNVKYGWTAQDHYDRPDSEFWDGFNGRAKTIFIDEFMSKISADLNNNKVGEVLTLLDPNPTIANMADVDSKGKVFAHPDIVFLATMTKAGQTHLWARDSQPLTQVEALDRRFMTYVLSKPDAKSPTMYTRAQIVGDSAGASYKLVGKPQPLQDVLREIHTLWAGRHLVTEAADNLTPELMAAFEKPLVPQAHTQTLARDVGKVADPQAPDVQPTLIPTIDEALSKQDGKKPVNRQGPLLDRAKSALSTFFLRNPNEQAFEMIKDQPGVWRVDPHEDGAKLVYIRPCSFPILLGHVPTQNNFWPQLSQRGAFTVSVALGLIAGVFTYFWSAPSREPTYPRETIDEFLNMLPDDLKYVMLARLRTDEDGKCCFVQSGAYEPTVLGRRTAGVIPNVQPTPTLGAMIAKVTSNTFTAQAGLQESELNTFKKSTASVGIFNKETKTFLPYAGAFWLGGRTLMLNTHVWDHLHTKETVCVKTWNGATEVFSQEQWTMTRKAVEGDVTLCIMPGSEQHPHLFGQIWDTALDSEIRGVYTLRWDPSLVSPEVRTVRAHTHMTHITTHEGMYIPQCFRTTWDRDTRLGDCGTLNIVKSENGLRIYGIHSAGNGTIALASVINKSSEITFQSQIRFIKEAVHSTHIPNKTNIVPTPLSSLVGGPIDPAKAIAHLGPFVGPDGTVISPLEQAINRLSVELPKRLHEPEFNHFFMEVLDSVYTKYCTNNGKLFCTQNQAINGIYRDGRQILKPIDMRTSAGYPFNAANTDLRKKRSLFRMKGANYVPNDYLIDSWVEIKAALPASVPYYTMFLKDEVLKKEKVQAGLTRAVYAESVIATLILRRIFGNLIANLYDQVPDARIAVGINPMSPHWEYLARLASTFEQVSDGDDKACDTHCGEEWTAFIQTILRYHDEDMVWRLEKLDGSIVEIVYTKEEVRQLLLGTQDTQIIIQRYVVEVSNNTSGNTMTALRNAVGITYYICRTWTDTAKTSHQKWDVALFLRTVWWILYGDDKLIGTHNAKLFDISNITSIADKYGFIVTSADKKGPMVPIADGSYTFLKRAFLWHNNRCLAPLEESSVHEILLWMNRGRTWEEQKYDLISAYLQTCQQDPRSYEQKKSALVAALRLIHEEIDWSRVDLNRDWFGYST